MQGMKRAALVRAIKNAGRAVSFGVRSHARVELDADGETDATVAYVLAHAQSVTWQAQHGTYRVHADGLAVAVAFDDSGKLWVCTGFIP